MLLRCREEETFIPCWWDCKLVQLLWKTVRRFLQKLKIILLLWSNNCASRYLYKENENTNWKRYLHQHVFCSTIYVRHRSNPTEWKDKENVTNIPVTEYYAVIKMNKILPTATNRWTLENYGSVQSVVSNSRGPKSQNARPPCPSPTPAVYSNSSSSSQWWHPAISSSVLPFSSCPQSLPASGSFPMSRLFTWGGQSTGVSASASALPMNTQDWSLGWTGWIYLQSKGLSRVFSNTTVQKHQFFSTRLSLQSSSYIHTWLLEKP